MWQGFLVWSVTFKVWGWLLFENYFFIETFIKRLYKLYSHFILYKLIILYIHYKLYYFRSTLHNKNIVHRKSYIKLQAPIFSAADLSSVNTFQICDQRIWFRHWFQFFFCNIFIRVMRHCNNNRIIIRWKIIA